MTLGWAILILGLLFLATVNRGFRFAVGGLLAAAVGAVGFLLMADHGTWWEIAIALGLLTASSITIEEIYKLWRKQ